MSCLDCGKDRPSHCGGLCNTCYKRDKYAASKYVCIQCASIMKQKPQNEHMSCAKCWSKELGRRYYEKNRSARDAYTKKWKLENLERARQYLRDHYKNNKSKYREKDAYRRAREVQATPAWADREELRKIYDSCPKGYHVDHIVPLNNPNVCGLHVPANLQVIPATENLKKSNKLNVS